MERAPEIRLDPGAQVLVVAELLRARADDPCFQRLEARGLQQADREPEVVAQPGQVIGVGEVPEADGGQFGRVAGLQGDDAGALVGLEADSMVRLPCSLACLSTIPGYSRLSALTVARGLRR